MKWTKEAEAAIKKVPFFVRKRVRQRVEKEALAASKTVVGIKDVNQTKQRYLNSMESEIKGFQLDVCFGPSGCKNRTVQADSLMKKLEKMLKKADFLTFLKNQVDGPLKFHHEFRVSLAECPNACSQPQIKDIGIIGACRPAVTSEKCTKCGLCVEVCPDDAVRLDEDQDAPEIDENKCVLCGLCVNSCPTGTIDEKERGYKLLLAGKLGRHPRLGIEIPKILSEKEVLKKVDDCIRLYKKKSTGGKRFSEIFQENDLKP